MPRRNASQRKDAVCVTKDCVASLAVADPVKRSLSIPICGSSEKAMAIAACGFAKYTRKRLISASPNTVVFIELLALGAKIITRIQRSLPREEAASRVDVATGSS